MLFEDFYEPCNILTATKTADGEGGSVTSFYASSAISCAIVLNSSSMGSVGGKNATVKSYTVTAPTTAGLSFGTVFRRIKDGACFRVTSDAGDKVTPSVAGFSFAQYTAEAYDLPGGIVADD